MLDKEHCLQSHISQMNKFLFTARRRLDRNLKNKVLYHHHHHDSVKHTKRNHYWV